MIHLLEKYKKLNNSYKKEYVFHLGAEAGFYSEFNMMVYAILYCLQNKYRFILYSADANFGYANGWEDYFKPFCSTTNFFLHKAINKRTTEPSLNLRNHLLRKIYRVCNPNTLLTYELWPKFYNSKFENQTFFIPELNIDTDFKGAASIICKMIYRFNEQTEREIAVEINSLQLPAKLIGANIRRGDKTLEVKYLISASTYLNSFGSKTDIKNVFVFTDDYRVIEELKMVDEQNIYKLYYFVNEEEKGYVNSDFVQLKSSVKKQQIIKMFASVEIMLKSEFAFGVYTNNPGFFMGMIMGEGKFISLQKKSWRQFEIDDVKDMLSEEYKNQIEEN